MKDILPYLWYAQRRVDVTPLHFVTAKTKLTQESKLWVLQNLVGRYSIYHEDDFFLQDADYDGVISFEDPTECLAFDLRWG